MYIVYTYDITKLQYLETMKRICTIKYICV